MSAKGTLVCQVCGTALNGGSEACPVCALRGALGPETTSVLDFSSEPPNNLLGSESIFVRICIH